MTTCKGGLLGAAAIALTALSPVAHAGFYDGKNVTVIVNAGAGGGLTRTGRLVVNALEKHLGRDVNMVVKNVPGGGGVKGLNFFAEKVKPDGLTLLWGTANPMAKLLKLPGVRYDPKKLIVIGAGSTSYISLIRTDAGNGVKAPADLLKAGTLLVGGRSTTDGLGIFARLPLDVLGLKYRYVPGYNAQPKLNAALRSKEIQSLTTGHPGYVAFYADTILKSGEALAVYYHSPLDKAGKPQRLPYYPAHVKNFIEFYRDTHGGKDPSGPMWEAYRWFSTYGMHAFSLYAPDGTDAAKVAELRAAFTKTMADPAFVAAYEKQLKAKPSFLVGDDGAYLVQDYDQIGADAVAGLKRLTARKR